MSVPVSAQTSLPPLLSLWHSWCFPFLFRELLPSGTFSDGILTLTAASLLARRLPRRMGDPDSDSFSEKPASGELC